MATWMLLSQPSPRRSPVDERDLTPPQRPTRAQRSGGPEPLRRRALCGSEETAPGTRVAADRHGTEGRDLDTGFAGRWRCPPCVMGEGEARQRRMGFDRRLLRWRSV